MNVETIDFCQQLEYHFHSEENHPELEGHLVDFVIIMKDYLSVRIHAKNEYCIKLLPITDADKNIIDEVDNLQKSGGVAFLRVDCWGSIHQLTFLLFQKSLVRIFNSTQSDAFEIGTEKNISGLTKSFILDTPDGKQYVFMQSSGNTGFASDSFRLIGDNRFCVVEKGFKGGWNVKTVSRRQSGQDVFGEIYIVGEKIKFVSEEKVLTAKINEEYKRLVSDSNNSELLRLWDEYSKVENDFELEAADKYLSICPQYTSRNRVGNMVEFHCRNLSAIGIKQFLSCDLGFSVVSDLDGKEIANRKNSKFQTFISDKIELNERDNNSLVAYLDEKDVNIPQSGYIVPSVKGAGYKRDRRNRARRDILQNKCQLKSLKLIIQSGEVVEEIKPVAVHEAKLNRIVFGPDATEKFNEKQIEAISTAVSTPDVALIQGPPGTGKTSIIEGILAYLEDAGKKKGTEYSVLVSSESHYAVNHAVDGISFCGFPCKRLGGKRGHDNSSNTELYENWINGIKESCEMFLQNEESKSAYTDNVKNSVLALEDCRKQFLSKNYSLSEMNIALSKLSRHLENDIPGNQYSLQIKNIQSKLTEEAPLDSLRDDQDKLISLLLKQSTDIDCFKKTGKSDLEQLCKFMRLHSELLPEKYQTQPPYWRTLQISEPEDSDFEESFYSVFTDIKEMLEFFSKEHHPVTSLQEDILQLFSQIENELQNKYKNDSWTVSTAVAHFLDHVEDVENLTQMFSEYANFAAATCQQSLTGRFGNMWLPPVKAYDYVIIDEAARANPLDLLIPMSLGKHIIMVGDHKQLPHMVENKIVNEVLERSGIIDEEESESKSRSDIEDILKQSLFARIYDSLWSKNLHRTVMLDHQFRMNEQIAEFISDAFYNGTLKSDEHAAATKVHSINRYSCEPMVWIDLKYSNKTGEDPDGHSKKRQCEANRAVQEATEIIKQTDDSFSIGVISFYSAQVELIEQLMADTIKNNPGRSIKVGTVDAFQGQEFDAVILSSVRSNANNDFKTAIGFLAAKQRQNVAFSRAKKLLIMIGDSTTLCNPQFEIDDDEKMISTKSFKMLYERSYILS